VPLDFNIALTGCGKQIVVNPQSLRLVEETDEEMMDDTAVPCQYQPDPIAKNKGVLTVLVTGKLETNWHRHYYLYFDEQGHVVPAFTAPMPAVLDGVPAQQDTLQNTTSSASYTVGTADRYQKYYLRDGELNK
jgi:hypothetical protein